MKCNTNYLADILRVCEIKDLIWVMRFQSPLTYLLKADHVPGGNWGGASFGSRGIIWTNFVDVY